MRFELIFGIMFVASIAFLGQVSAEPEVLMVNISPGNIDNQVEEEVNFDADCTVCNEEQLEYFYWNSSIDGVLASDSAFMNLNFVMSSTLFSEGDHNITLQVKGNGSWSDISDNSTVVLSVTGDDGKGSGITVNFDITPPSLHLGETARFESCTTMQPEPQPCVDDVNPDLSFDWKIQWNGAGDWSYLGDSESFESNQFQEGNHNVRLIITDNSNDDVSLPLIQELLVLPPIPILNVQGLSQLTIKEGQELVIITSCVDNTFEEIECSYDWEMWEDNEGGLLLFRLDSKNLTLNNLTEEVHMYDLMGRAFDESGTYSSWVHIFITVNPPNQSPQASIDISPDSLGGLTPEYYQDSTLIFGSTNSNDPDGQIVAFKWWHNNEVVSEDSTWTSSFSELSLYQVKLEVQDDNGEWSANVSTNFKTVVNTPPKASFDISSEGASYSFNSTSSDLEGAVVYFEWFVNNEYISSNKNTTWLANASGAYEITLMVMDDGGLWSNTTQSIDVVLSLSAQKNFVVSFSSKNIEPGDSFTMNFSKTTGDVNYYEVVVNNPDGSRDKITIPTADGYEYTLMFPVKGVYTLDITVIWADGIAQENMADFYGPTVNVGGDGTEPTEEIPLEEVEDSGLPSISLIVTLLITSLIAIGRRQR